MDGINVCQQLRSNYPELPILVLSSFSDEGRLFASMRAGATGYLLKDISGTQLVQAIRGAFHGIPQFSPELTQILVTQLPIKLDPFQELTQREREVLILIARGKSNKEIGSALHLTEVTIKGYVSNILGKLQISDRTQAALYAVRYGLILHEELPKWE
jgi:DNA-binding NarL/FixJ family response regulator